MTAADVMIPISRVGTLRKDARLDRPTMTRLLESGFSRVPLHAGAVEGVDRYLIVKEHILLDPDDAVPVAGLRAYRRASARAAPSGEKSARVLRA